MSYEKEFKKAQKKQAFDFNEKVDVPSPFGGYKVSLSEFTEYVSNCVDNPAAFVVCYDKIQEDWEFTESLMKYTTEEVVNLLASEHELFDEDKEWKGNLIKYFKEQIKRLEK